MSERTGPGSDHPAGQTPAPPSGALPPPTTQFTPPTPAPSSGRGSAGLIAGLLAGGFLLIVALGGLAWWLLRGDDESVRLEPVAVAVPDAFTDSVAVTEAALPADLEVPEATRASLPPPTVPAAPAAREAGIGQPQPVAGAMPGLFGGTRNNASCDVDRLIAFLAANPDKAAAWAAVMGITPGQIESFVRTLTPVVLTRDTRVTNHGYANGRATPVQAVLQAGTAVLVDDRGLPRVKCGCGNPLLPPAAVPVGTRVIGDPWPGWDPVHIIDIGVDIRIDVLVVIDLEGGPPFERPVGSDGDDDRELGREDLCALLPDAPACEDGPLSEFDDDLLAEPPEDEPALATGEVQATLRWESDADLDLAVTDPNGDIVAFYNREVPSGGFLDHDVIPGVDPGAARVENIVWPDGRAPPGTYLVEVTLFSEGAQAPPHGFSLEVLVDGVRVVAEAGQLSSSGETKSWNFTVD